MKKLLVGLLFAVMALGASLNANAQVTRLSHLVFTQGDAGTSGSIASLAPSNAAALNFDLGENWHLYNGVFCTISVGGPSTSASTQANSADTSSYTTLYRTIGWAPNSAGSVVYTSWNPATGGTQSIGYRPMGRYQRVQVNNLDATNAFSASANWRCVAMQS